MKKAYIIVFLTLFLGSAYAQEPVDAYTIIGDISGLGNNSLVMSVHKNDNTWQRDTIIAREGKFKIAGIATQPIESAYIRTIGTEESCDFSVFLEPGTITVKGDMSSNAINVTGSPNNNDLTALNAAENKTFRKVKQLSKQLQQAKSAKDTTTVNTIKHALDKEYSHADKQRTETRIRFIKTHPNSLASATALYVVQDHISWEKLENLYKSLTPEVRQSQFCKFIPDKIAAGKRTDIGQKAPDFTLPDVNGDPIKLSSLKGKYVLIDFWASWCVPCRRENKHVKQVFDRYKDKNFMVLGVSRDSDRAKWKEAIVQDKLPWVNVCDTKVTGPGSVSFLYGVQPIPDNFLIDPQGKIIGRRLFGEELDQKLAEVLK